MVRVNCESGLRARKKAATRAALSDAALALALEHGVDAVTVEGIADAAGVSTRTFHNYFSSKEEAVLSHGERIAQQWADALRARPAAESIWDAIEVVLLEEFSVTDVAIESAIAAARVIEASPGLLARKADLRDWAKALMCQAIADRTGTSAAADLYPRVVNQVAIGVVDSAVDLWRNGYAGDRTLSELISAGLAQVRSGLPDPAHEHAQTTTGQDL